MERSSTASASKGKVERFDLNFPSNHQMRAIAHSVPALQNDNSEQVFDSTNPAVAFGHQVKTSDMTTLVVDVAGNHFQSLDHFHH